MIFLTLVACCFSDEFCEGYPHNFTPTPGYWIECSRQSGPSRGRSSEQQHGIKEEGSQEDSDAPSHGSGSTSGSDRDEESDESNEAGGGGATGGGDDVDKSQQTSAAAATAGGANGSVSMFTSTASTSTTDRSSGRKVQLVHRNIQVEF